MMRNLRSLIIFTVLLTLIITSGAFAKNDNQNYYRPIPMVTHEEGGDHDWDWNHDFYLEPYIVDSEPLPRLYWDPEDVSSPRLGNEILIRLDSQERIFIGPELSGYDHCKKVK